MTGVAKLPVIFLDVDGTLIPLKRRPGPEVSTAGPMPSGAAANPLLSRLDAAHGARLSGLGGELVWATSWMDEANEEISPRLGLPALPVVSWADGVEDAVTGRLHWKTRELVAWAAGRAFIWIDDEIGEADRAWVAARHPGDAMLHRVDPDLGLTDADFAAIQRWLALRNRLIVPIHELTRRVQHLLDDLCVGLGFCLSPVEQNRLRLDPPLNPEAFVDAVFRAEGLDPQLNGHLRRQVSDTVVRHLPGIVSAYRADASG